MLLSLYTYHNQRYQYNILLLSTTTLLVANTIAATAINEETFSKSHQFGLISKGSDALTGSPSEDRRRGRGQLSSLIRNSKGPFLSLIFFLPLSYGEHGQYVFKYPILARVGQRRYRCYCSIFIITWKFIVGTNKLPKVLSSGYR